MTRNSLKQFILWISSFSLLSTCNFELTASFVLFSRFVPEVSFRSGSQLSWKRLVYSYWRTLRFGEHIEKEYGTQGATNRFPKTSESAFEATRKSKTGKRTLRRSEVRSKLMVWETMKARSGFRSVCILHLYL